MMLEDGGRAVQEHERQVKKGSSRPGKLDGLVPGSSMIAYSVSSAEKLLNIGRYLSANDGGQEIDVHAYGVATDYHMNAKWKHLYLTNEGRPRFAGEEDGSVRPMIERIRTRDIIRLVGLSSKGVLYHKDSRELDLQRWSWKPHREGEAYAAVSRLAYLVPGIHGFRHLDQPYDQFLDKGKAALELGALECSCDIDSIIRELQHKPHEELGWPTGGYWPGRIWENAPSPEVPPRGCRELGAVRTCGERGNGRYEVDVLELFAGGASLTRACLVVGMKVASALDVLYQSYGRAWDLSKREDQADAAYLIVFVFKPKIIHLGLQCRDYCALGKNQPSPESEACLEFSVLCMAHQEKCELGASLENPWVSDIWDHPVLEKHLERRIHGSPWTIARGAGCQCGMCFQGADRDEEGGPFGGQPIE